ncbi:MAG: 16S rRNA (uracil(1498)-N(3))-methyltransferase [Deltaproteobacteria bacterium]|nr:16S rRNA (uracil(1498)-N(3))-methyltransferase [Deltaproteobacteria bacterium]
MRAVRRLHLPDAWSCGEELLVRGSAHHYLARVLRLEAGQQLTLFDGMGQERTATVRGAERDGLLLALGPLRLSAVPEGEARVLLLAGMTRGAGLDRVVRETTELGVSELCPVLTEHSVAVPGPERRGARQQRWQRVAVQAARQCGRATVPRVHAPLALAQACSRLEEEAESWPVRLVGWPGESHGLSLSPAGGVRGVALLVGPEGGLSPQELQLVEQHGFCRFGLGPRILRAETAALVAVTLVQHRLGQLG